MLSKIIRFFRSPWLLREAECWRDSVATALQVGTHFVPARFYITMMSPERGAEPRPCVLMEATDDRRHGIVKTWFPHPDLKHPINRVRLEEGIAQMADMWASRWADLWLQEAERWLEEQKESP